MAHEWLFTDTLNNVHVEEDKDFSQAENITHTGALLIGTYDNFTYQRKEQETADKILELLRGWE